MKAFIPKCGNLKNGGHENIVPLEANRSLLNEWYGKLQSIFQEKIHVGTIVSGDSWNREVDRIKWFCEKVNSKCEDMESYAVYEVCMAQQVPVVGIRMISNSSINQEEYDRTLAEKLQKLLIGVLSS